VVIGIRNLEERDAGGTIARKFFSLGQLNGASNRYYTVNAQGSTSQMTDNASVITASYAYSPFGIASRTSGSESSDYQYSGYFAHERSSLNLATFRLYSAQNGRWLSRDPIFETGLMHIAQPGIAQIDMNTLNGASAKVLNLKRSQFGLGATNLYLYVLNNPVGLIDPLGLGEGDATFCQALCSAIATGGIAACLLCGVPFWVCMALAAAGSVGCIFVCERIFGPDSGVAGKEPDCPCPSR